MAVQVGNPVSLPTNPNALIYGANATEVLRGRPFTDVQRICARALDRFGQSSGLVAEVLFGWRIVQDRRNVRSTQVTASFVVDGPAGAIEIGLIDAVMEASSIPWTPMTIERVPRNAVHSLISRGGSVEQIWVEEQGELVASRLVLHPDDVVRIHRTRPDVARADAFLPGVGHVVGVERDLTEADLEIARMRLAWTLDHARQIVAADGKIDAQEARFLETVFPETVLNEMRIGSEAERAAVAAVAKERLPNVLGYHDKLALVSLLFSCSYSDGQLEASEMKVVREAGAALGLSRDDVVAWLRRYW